MPNGLTPEERREIRAQLERVFEAPVADALVEVFERLAERQAEAALRQDIRALYGVIHELATAIRDLQKTVTQLAEAQARTEERVGRLEEAVAHLIEAQARMEERIGRLEEAVAHLVEAQARMEERVGRLEERTARLEEAVAQLVEAQARMEERVGRLEEAVAHLIEAQARMEERVGRLEERTARLEEAVAQLVEAQARMEERVGRLEEAVVRLTEAQARTEEELRALAASHAEAIKRLDRLEQIVAQVVETQKQILDEHVHMQRVLRQLAQQLGAISETLGADLEDMAYIVLRDVLKRELGWDVEPLERTWKKWDDEVEEINIFGRARDPKRPEGVIWIVGEAKYNLTVREVEQFAKLVERARKHLEGEVFPVCFCRRARPEVEERVRELGFRLVYSYGRLI
jgi:chromosome segregation ATPase